MARFSRSETLFNLVKKVLKDEARKGHTTLRDASAAVMAHMQNHGGVGAHGISHGMLLLAARRIVADEVRVQFKHTMPENVAVSVFRNAPPELSKVLSRIPAWIAVQKGAGARRVPALMATPEDWEANGRIKHEIGRATVLHGDRSFSVADMMRTYGYKTLSDAAELNGEDCG